MRAIEANIEREVGQESPHAAVVVAGLLGIDADGMEQVMIEETKNIHRLLRSHYERFGADPNNVGNHMGLAFVQGVTFAVAAHRLQEEA